MLQLRQLPGSQARVNLPLAEVKGAREKDTIVSVPKGEKKGKRWKIHLVPFNSWKHSSPQRRKLGLQKSVGKGGGEKYLKSVGWVG